MILAILKAKRPDNFKKRIQFNCLRFFYASNLSSKTI